MLICPLYAKLPPAQQQQVFQKTPPNTRKFILATNVAETSITIPGIAHVIDAGYAKVKRFRSLAGVEELCAEPISQSSANQRCGRAGREVGDTTLPRQDAHVNGVLFIPSQPENVGGCIHKKSSTVLPRLQNQRSNDAVFHSLSSIFWRAVSRTFSNSSSWILLKQMIVSFILIYIETLN